MTTMLREASDRQLYQILATLECAHEPDQIEAAERKLINLGCSRAELEAEWDRREAIRAEKAKTVEHVPV